MGHPSSGSAELRDEASGKPLVVSIDSPEAMEPSLVGQGAALMALAKRAGLPVADGVVVTTAATASDEIMRALKHAWNQSRGTVRIALSGCENPGGLTSIQSFLDATTWMELIRGLRNMLAHDQIENPERRHAGWGIVILKVPSCNRSVFLRIGPGFLETRASPRAQPTPNSSTQRWLRALARLAFSILEKPVSLEIMIPPSGRGYIVDMRMLSCSDQNRFDLR